MILTTGPVPGFPPASARSLRSTARVSGALPPVPPVDYWRKEVIGQIYTRLVRGFYDRTKTLSCQETTVCDTMNNLWKLAKLEPPVLNLKERILL